MEPQSELCHPPLEGSQTGSGIGFMFEADNKVIRIADHNTLALRVSLSPRVDPEIKDVVQKNVGNKEEEVMFMRTEMIMLMLI